MIIDLLSVITYFASAMQPMWHDDIVSSAYCLVHLWPKSELRVTTGAYYSYRDTQSYRGTTHVILVTRSGKRRGQVFDFEVHKKAIPVVRLVNNANIRFTRKGPEFATPPLGGVWTQDFLLHAMSMALNAQAASLQDKSVRTKKTVVCESYAATQ
jgi:hypothetical protein